MDSSTLIFHPGISFYLFLNPFLANTVEILTGLLLSCLGIWYFLKHIGFKNFAALVGSIVYIFIGPVFFQHSYHLGFMAVLLLPWCLLTFHKYDNTGYLRYLWASVLLCVLAVHSLDVDLLVYLYIGLFIDRVVCMPRFRRGFYICKWLGFFILSGLTGLLWFLPLFEWLKHSSREFHSYVGILTPDFLNLIFAIFTNHWFTKWPYDVFYFYFGPGAMWLVKIGLIRLKRKEYVFRYFKWSLIMPGFYILIRIIQNYYSTFLDSMDPWRGMLVFCFSLSMIAAKGAEKILNNDYPFKETLIWGLLSIVFSFITFNCGMGIGIWLPLIITGISILLTYGASLKKAVYLTKLSLLFTVGASLLFPAIKYVRNEEFCIRPCEPTNGIVEFYHSLFEKTAAWDEHWRISVFYGTNNITALFKFKSVPNYTSVYNERFETTFCSDGLIKANKIQPYWMALKTSDASKLSYYGVKYLILDTAATWSSWNQFQPEFNPQGWIKRDDLSWPMIQVWENKHFIGRAYIISSSGERRGGVEFIEDKPESVVLRVKAEQGDRVVLADLYYPGWEVFVDGKQKIAEVYHGCLRSVRLSQGTHIIKWEHKGRVQREGLVLSGVVCLLLLISLILLSTAKIL